MAKRFNLDTNQIEGVDGANYTSDIVFDLIDDTRHNTDKKNKHSHSLQPLVNSWDVINTAAIGNALISNKGTNYLDMVSAFTSEGQFSKLKNMTRLLNSKARYQLMGSSYCTSLKSQKEVKKLLLEQIPEADSILKYSITSSNNTLSIIEYLQKNYNYPFDSLFDSLSVLRTLLGVETLENQTEVNCSYSTLDIPLLNNGEYFLGTIIDDNYTYNLVTGLLENNKLIFHYTNIGISSKFTLSNVIKVTYTKNDNVLTKYLPIKGKVAKYLYDYDFEDYKNENLTEDNRKVLDSSWGMRQIRSPQKGKEDFTCFPTYFLRCDSVPIYEGEYKPIYEIQKKLLKRVNIEWDKLAHSYNGDNSLQDKPEPVDENYSKMLENCKQMCMFHAVAIDDNDERVKKYLFYFFYTMVQQGLELFQYRQGNQETLGFLHELLWDKGSIDTFQGKILKGNCKYGVISKTYPGLYRTKYGNTAPRNYLYFIKQNISDYIVVTIEHLQITYMSWDDYRSFGFRENFSNTRRRTKKDKAYLAAIKDLDKGEESSGSMLVPLLPEIMISHIGGCHRNELVQMSFQVMMLSHQKVKHNWLSTWWGQAIMFVLTGGTEFLIEQVGKMFNWSEEKIQRIKVISRMVIKVVGVILSFTPLAVIGYMIIMIVTIIEMAESALASTMTLGSALMGVSTIIMCCMGMVNAPTIGTATVNTSASLNTIGQASTSLAQGINDTSSIMQNLQTIAQTVQGLSGAYEVSEGIKDGDWLRVAQGTIAMVQALNMPKISKVELPKNIDYTAIGKEIGKSSIEIGSNLYFEHQINKAQDKLDNAYSDFQKEIQNNIKEHYDQITQMSNNYNSDINNSRNILRTWCVELSNLQAKSFGLNSINKLIIPPLNSIKKLHLT